MIEGFGLNVNDVCGFFNELGYDCYRYGGGGRVIPAAAPDIVSAPVKWICAWGAINSATLAPVGSAQNDWNLS